MFRLFTLALWSFAFFIASFGAGSAAPETAATPAPMKIDSNSNPTPYYYAGYPGPPTWFWILGFGSGLAAVAIYFADKSVRASKPQ
jgi:hypothetical protein